MPLSTLVHERHGSGQPLVLIHGIGHRRQAWQPVLDQLAQHYEVITVDLAGFGESAPYPKGVPYDMDNACLDLSQNFELWGIEKPHVVGNSMGGAISLELAARGLASSATVLSPAGFFTRVGAIYAVAVLSVLWVLSRAPERVLRLLLRLPLPRRLTGALLYAHPERQTFESAYGDAVALRRCRGFAGVARQGPGYTFTQQVDVPVTVAWGRKDRVLPHRQAATARRVLPHARHVTLEDAGHVPMIDSPDEIVRLVEETIERATGRAGAA